MLRCDRGSTGEALLPHAKSAAQVGRIPMKPSPGLTEKQRKLGELVDEARKNLTGHSTLEEIARADATCKAFAEAMQGGMSREDRLHAKRRRNVAMTTEQLQMGKSARRKLTLRILLWKIVWWFIRLFRKDL